MLGLAEVVGAQPNCWPNVRFEHDAGETAGNQDRNWAPAGHRVPWGCLLKILAAICGLAHRLVGGRMPTGGVHADGPKQCFLALVGLKTQLGGRKKAPRAWPTSKLGGPNI